MPITQERFMTVVRGAKSILLVQRKVREAAMHDIGNTLSIANSVLGQSQDEAAKRAIGLLLNHINRINQIFFELRDSDTEDLMAIVLSEEIHFNKKGRENDKARYYAREARRKQGILPRAKEAELQPPPMRSEPIAQVSNFENTKAYKDFQRQTREEYWPDSLRDQNPMAQKIQKERAENQKQFGDTSLDAKAREELTLMRQERGVTDDDNRLQSEIDHMKMGGASYDRNKVKSTSVPSLDKLNELPIPPPGSDENIL